MRIFLYRVKNVVTGLVSLALVAVFAGVARLQRRQFNGRRDGRPAFFSDDDRPERRQRYDAAGGKSTAKTRYRRRDRQSFPRRTRRARLGVGSRRGGAGRTKRSSRVSRDFPRASRRRRAEIAFDRN